VAFFLFQPISNLSSYLTMDFPHLVSMKDDYRERVWSWSGIPNVSVTAAVILLTLLGILAIICLVLPLVAIVCCNRKANEIIRLLQEISERSHALQSRQDHAGQCN